jgi:hypothetical protein
VGDDGGQHLVEVEARADRLADHPERLQLVDLAPELAGARLQGVDQVDVADGDGRLGGEGGQNLDRAVAEPVDLGPPGGQDADHLAVEQHGDAHGRPEPAVLLDVEPAVLGIGEHVDDLLGPAL